MRSIIQIRGEDAAKFLQSIITNDLPNKGLAYSLILNSLGRFLFDIFIIKQDDGYLLDAQTSQTSQIISTLKSYILRSKVIIEDLSDQYSVSYTKAPGTYKDPRFHKLGYRTIVPKDHSLNEDYLDDKYQYSIPDGDFDLIYGKSMPQEYGIDLLGGISYSKGCYVGQEVISRTRSQGTVRKGIFKVTAQDSIDRLSPGEVIFADKYEIGVLASAHHNLGIALIRTHDYEKHQQMQLTIDGISIAISKPEWWT